MIQSDKNPPVIIDFLRHGECDDNVFLRGKTDSKLTTLGELQMKNAIVSQTYDQVISSPKTRCLAFAEHWCESYQVPLIVNANWQERDFGEWDGLTYLQIQQQAPQTFKTYLNHPIETQIPQAETFAQFSAKISQAWVDLQAFACQSNQSSILVVTHGGPMRWVLKEVLKMEESGLFHLGLHYGTRVRIQLFNSEQGSFAKLVGIFPA